MGDLDLPLSGGLLSSCWASRASAPNLTVTCSAIPGEQLRTGRMLEGYSRRPLELQLPLCPRMRRALIPWFQPQLAKVSLCSVSGGVPFARKVHRTKGKPEPKSSTGKPSCKVLVAGRDAATRRRRWRFSSSSPAASFAQRQKHLTAFGSGNEPNNSPALPNHPTGGMSSSCGEREKGSQKLASAYPSALALGSEGRDAEGEATPSRGRARIKESGGKAEQKCKVNTHTHRMVHGPQGPSARMSEPPAHALFMLFSV